MTAGAAGGYVGLANQGATCYLNSLLQTLFMTPEFTRELFLWRLSAGADRETSIPHQLQMLFARMLTESARRDVSTVDLTRSFRWDGEQAFVQHDVQELCRLLFDALEEAFAGSADVTRLFRGQLVDYVACKPPHTYASTRSDAFLDLQLAVRGFGSARPIKSVVEGLQNFLAAESLDGANQYELAPGQKVDAWKGLRLAELPPLLTVHLKRFDMDYTTMRNVKVNDRVEFGETLSFAKHCSANGVEGNQPSAGAAEGWYPVEPKARLDGCTGTVLDYELYSVLVHAGTATSGHYYAYIKDVSRNTWLKFDDSAVSVASWADVESTFGVNSGGASNLIGVGGGGLFGSSSAIAPAGLRSTTAYMLTYRTKRSSGESVSTSVSSAGGHEMYLDTAAAAIDAVDGAVSGPDPLDPRAVEVPSFLKQALQADAVAKAAAEAARMERESHLEVAVHCSPGLLPSHLPQQVVVTFRCGNTAASLLRDVGQALQRLEGVGTDTNSKGRAPLVTPDTTQVCLLDLKENVVRLRFSADAPLDPKSMLDSRRGTNTPLVYFLEKARTGKSGEWFFGDREPPSTELAVLNPKARAVSVTLLHAAADGIVERRDVTLGHRPSESQVRCAAAAHFGLEPPAAIQIFRGQSMVHKDFVPMPTSTVVADGHSWENIKWDAHPYLVVTTSGGQGQAVGGQCKWMKSAVSHAMTVRVLFTGLNESAEEDEENTTTDALVKSDQRLGRRPGINGVPAFTTHSLLFDARQNTHELKKALAAVLNEPLVNTGTINESNRLQRHPVDPSNFNALLKMGMKETVLNRPAAPPFQLARFRSGFSRLPSCIPLRLVRGSAANLHSRTLALRWHVPGGPGIALWSETVNAEELSLQACKQWLLGRLCAKENMCHLPTAARDAVKAASTLLQQPLEEQPRQRVGLRLRLYNTVSTHLRPGKVLADLPRMEEEQDRKLSELIPPSDVPVPVGLTLLQTPFSNIAVEIVGQQSSSVETTTDREGAEKEKAHAGSLACEHRLSTGGHVLVTLYRWSPASAGELGPPTELAVEASISAANLCQAVATQVRAQRAIAAEHIELVRHWPRDAVVGPGQVIGKSWSRDAFDVTVLGTDSCGSQTASPGKRSRLGGSTAEGGDEEEGNVPDDILRDGDTVYWRDKRVSAASSLGGNSISCEQRPTKKKAKQQSILSLFGSGKKLAQHEKLSLH